ncbi:hypothetical protein [Cognatiyoonia sp. IB215182]|uniref:hypothetical protein n=1 Tax=Cognatiyoonia sp. IB215182 TaxID=3097353 RepID=UPI002A0F2BEB|nr:hypothetical protein [Cognatiyoonia sp. IB215182]MDX8354098.1 hypothetical protein [Cognatiyoonia sp. IB215182]
MRYIGSTAAAVLALLLWVSSVQQVAGQTKSAHELNPIECYRALNQLDPFYRSALVEDCFAVPAYLCLEDAEPATCIGSATNSVENFIETASQQLPRHLPMTGTWPRHYQRAIEGIATAPPSTFDCDQLGPEICRFLGLLIPTMNGFRAARLAGIDEGFYPNTRLAVRVVDQWEDWNDHDPIACAAVIASLSGVYRFHFAARCMVLGTRACRNPDDEQQCLQSHLARMHAAAAEMIGLLRTRMEAGDSGEEIYAFQVENLEMVRRHEEACGPQLSNEHCEYALLVATLVGAFELAHDVDPVILQDFSVR